MALKTKPTEITRLLLDESVPAEQRAAFMCELATYDPKQFQASIGQVLAKLSAAKGADELAEKARGLQAMIDEINAGPQRHAHFLSASPANGAPARAQVLLQDGARAWVPAPDSDLLMSLRRGDAVLIEANGRAVLSKSPGQIETGEEARLERRIDEWHVEVVLRDEDKNVYQISALLKDALDSGEVTSGRYLVVCSRRQFAFAAVPQADGFGHFRYLSREPVPDVIVERDIGSPPRFILNVKRHVRREMTNPGLGRKYRLERCQTYMLTGPSGTGKSLCVAGLIREVLEIASAVVGVSIQELPPRVMRLQTSKVLSKWLGASDKNIDRFFDEVDQLADQTFTGPDGRTHTLPLIVVFEEADGLARARGEDALYDRIQTTLLNRLDTTNRRIVGQLVIFLFTTNLPALLDPAFVRRAGGIVERFSRLNRRTFETVLDKLLRDRSIAPLDGEEPQSVRSSVVREVTSWMFSPNGDKGQIELQFVSSAAPVTKYRRDFLTPALVARAVQQASRRASDEEEDGGSQPGLTASHLICALHEQVRGIVDALDVHNAGDYLTLPDGARVASVRRIEQPLVLPVELEARAHAAA